MTGLPVVHLVAGARPNFMKVAPVWRTLRDEGWCRPVFVHAGQHYDAAMSQSFLDELGLPTPDFHLGVGSGTHAEQTARGMVAYEQLGLEHPPDWLVVVGDVNSTLACTLAAAKLGVPIAHLEAGLRSYDRTMPEEVNRVVTDALAALCWTPSEDADDNLRREGVASKRIELVGNVMIDALELQRPRWEADGTAERLGLAAGGFALVTLHRPVNVDDRQALVEACEAVAAVARRLPVVFSVHPRTSEQLAAHDLLGTLEGTAGVHLLPPLPHSAFIGLLSRARVVVTDSGGVQEETTYLGVPCLTLRRTTERPVTVTLGTNRLVDVALLGEALDDVLGAPPGRRVPPLWDGKAASRVAASLRRAMGGQVP